MDKNIDAIWHEKLEQVAQKLRSNRMEAFVLDSLAELEPLLDQLVEKGSRVASGGSMTLKETGVIDYLSKGDFRFYDRSDPEITTPEQIADTYLQAFSADYYFVSSNAITAEGWLYNVDGRGNRVAAMLYGPKKVIVIVGRNKWAPDLEAAITRNREFAAPANCIRLNRNTPCTRTGSCQDCKSEDRICNEYTIIRRQGDKDRIKVILLNFDAGY